MFKAIVIGNLGNDPELRYSAQGNPYIRFNVASNDRKRTPDGEYEDHTEWIRVTLTGQRAETLSQYLKKGSRVYVDGRLEARPWADQQGQMRAGLELLANEVQFMSSNRDEDQPTRQPVAAGARNGQPPRAQQVRHAAEDNDELEDLPF